MHTLRSMLRGQLSACFGFVYRTVFERHAGWPESSKMRIQREDSGIVHEDSEFAIPVSLSTLPLARTLAHRAKPKTNGEFVGDLAQAQYAARSRRLTK